MNEHIQIAECYAEQIKAMLDLMQTAKGAGIESINVVAEMCLNMFSELMDEVEWIKTRYSEKPNNLKEQSNE